MDLCRHQLPYAWEFATYTLQRPVAERLSLSMSQLVLAWVLREENVCSAIIGATRPEQIEQNAGAVGVKLDDATCREIDKVLEGVIPLAEGPRA
jgi:aryl-alcohol dehydrogenase-like predicted oxidoreductase